MLTSTVRPEHSHYLSLKDAYPRRLTRLMWQACGFGFRRSPWSRCASALRHAVKSSERGDDHAFQKWAVAKNTCRQNNIDFQKAVDRPLESGKTALQRLAKTRDHQALHFVQSNIPPGVYQGDLYLGRHCNRDSSRPISWWSLKGAPAEFGYCGQTGPYNLDFQGYGVLTWKNGITYVGEYSTQFKVSFKPVSIRTLSTLREPDCDNLCFEYNHDWLGVKMAPYRTSNS